MRASFMITPQRSDPKLLKASNWSDYFFQDIKGFYFSIFDFLDLDNKNKKNYQGDKCFRDIF